MAVLADFSPGGVTDALHEALQGVASVDPRELADGTLHDAVVDLQRIRSLVESVAAPFTIEWDRRRLWASDGSRSPKARLARAARCSTASAARAVGLAAKLDVMPLVAAALADGSISVDHAWRLGVARTAERAQHFAECEEILVGQAAVQDDFEVFRRFVEHWEHMADDLTDTADDKHRRQRAGRRLHLSQTFRGTWELKGTFDRVDGEILNTVMGRMVHELIEADWTAARAEHGDAATTLDLGRSAQQRRADALVEIARRSTSTVPGAVPARPLISVLVGYEQLHGPIRETFNSTVLSTRDLVDLLGKTDPLTEADIERIVFDPDDLVIEMSQRARYFTGALRRAIEVRDRHCTHPGCHVPAEFCHADHKVEHTDGGPTTQSNGRLLCPTHNRQRPGRRKTPPTDDDDDPADGPDDSDDTEDKDTRP